MFSDALLQILIFPDFFKNFLCAANNPSKKLFLKKKKNRNVNFVIKEKKSKNKKKSHTTFV